MLIRRYLGRADFNFIKKYSSRVIKVEEGELRGYAALIDVIEVNYPLIVGEKGCELCFCDNGYRFLSFQPDGEKWKMTGAYDERGNAVEWYFDITKINSVDENGEPYCDDLFLDAALTPDGTVKILDEDELLEALENGIITKDDYETAHRVLNEMIENKIIGTDFVEEMCERLMELFE